MPMKILKKYLACVLVVMAATARADQQRLQFNRDVRPILSDKCFACHGPDSGTREADLRLDTAEGAHEWAVVPGDPDDSTVVSRITETDPDLRMPPRESKKPPLTADEIAVIRRWIEQGAEYEPHWSYIKPSQPEIPQVTDKRWPNNAIDNFILAGLESEDVTPATEADRVTLLRRVTFDLTGLPPTRAEVEAYLADDSPDAYEKVVDRLLASPRFGERMATWWFDLVRFANTVGYHGDQVHSVVPYRDYVIKSFNENLAFDQFTIEQLAGDLLPNPTTWQTIATCYNRLLQTSHEGGIQDKEYVAIHQADRIRNVAEVWLGASMGCAQCHDHKFDPYSMRDFYSMGAFFADVDHYGSFVSVGQNANPTQRPPEILAPTLPVWEKLEPLDPQIKKLEQELSGRFSGDFRKKLAELTKLRHERADLLGQFERVMVTVARDEPRTVRILNRGDWMDDSGEIVGPAIPVYFGQLDTGDRRPTRLDLAHWIVADDNPMTGRVVTNRLWQLFYGRGLSSNLIELGSQGAWPDQPQLLDWLATDFVANGWDIKRTVRLMVTSSTYRQSSRPRPELFERDPNNTWLARQNHYRLDAEMVRDSALAVSGLLVHQLGGEIGRPYQPRGYYQHLNFPVRKYQAANDENQYRRGVYTHWQRQYLHPWLKAFDAPTREECTAGRVRSNTPSASLVLLNDPSFVEAARTLAQRALAEVEGNDETRLRWLWSEVQSRDGRDEEIAVLAAVLTKHREHYGAGDNQADQLTTVGLAARTDEAATPELAAWTSVCRVLLNLSETITRY